MDLDTITDVDKLKSMAFDQVQLMNQAQTNLQLLQQRIVVLQTPTPEVKED